MIGKATVALVVLFILLTVVASRVPSEWAMLCIGGGGILALFGYLFFIKRFADEHPELAATEGATYVQTKQIALAAKGVPVPPLVPIIPDPQNPTLLEHLGQRIDE
jgi:hypothetical protein